MSTPPTLHSTKESDTLFYNLKSEAAQPKSKNVQVQIKRMKYNNLKLKADPKAGLTSI